MPSDYLPTSHVNSESKLRILPRGCLPLCTSEVVVALEL